MKFHVMTKVSQEGKEGGHVEHEFDVTVEEGATLAQELFGSLIESGHTAVAQCGSGRKRVVRELDLSDTQVWFLPVISGG